MQKKLLAVAVAGALGAPAFAFAQAAAGTSTVQIFGTIYVEVDKYKGMQNATSGMAAPERIDFDYIRTAGSEIGVKGEESLGGGMAAWFQCTSTADIRGPGGSTAAGGAPATNTSIFSAGTWCSRNSALGLKGVWGNTYLGIWDTPMKRAYSIGNVGSGETGGFGNSGILMNGATNPGQAPAAVPPTGGAATLAATAPGAVPVLSTTAAAISFVPGVASTANSIQPSRGVWSRREVNSFFYDSPNFAGFQVNGHMQFANASTNYTSGGSNAKPRTWGLAATYSAGPFAAAAFYEKHKDSGARLGGPALGGPTAAAFNGEMEDHAYGLSGAFTIGPVKFGGVWKREEYDVMTATVATAALANGFGMGEHKVTSWHLGFDWNIVGPHGLRGGYTRAGDVKGSCISNAPDCGGYVSPTGVGYRPGLGGRPDAQSSTASSQWQLKYVFAFSKRTEFNFGYSKINNKANAGYNFSDIGGNIAPGRDPSVWVASMKHTF